MLMVSNFRYFSPKMLTLRGRVPFVALVAVVLGFAIVLVVPATRAAGTECVVCAERSGAVARPMVKERGRRR